MGKDTEEDIWEQIKAKPDKKYKLTGHALLAMRKEYQGLEKTMEKKEKVVGDLDGIKEKLKLEIQKLNGEITTLKNENTNQAGKIKDLETKVAGLQGDKDGLIKERDAKVSDLEGKLNDANSTISEKGAKISELEGKIESLQDRVISLENDITALEGDKAKLEQEVDELLAPQRALTTPTMKDQNVRACNTCKQYVLIKEGVYKSLRAMQIFEGAHNAHMLATLDISEVPSGYEDVTTIFIDKLK